jgi:DNA-binding Xre family transcriptional regulator
MPIEEAPPAPAPSAQQRVFRWNVATLALTRGFKKVPRLALKMATSRQSVYPIWNGMAAQVSLEMLSRLAHTLEADPGDWFRWCDRERGVETSDVPTDPRALLWNVAAQAETRGLDMNRLGFRAELYAGSIAPIWKGEAQAVAVESLGKLAQALDMPDRPFALGDLFAWEVEPDRG